MTSTPALAETPPRPKTIDYAVVAIAARCVLGVVTAAVAWTARSSIRNQLHKDHKDWSAAKLSSQTNTSLWMNLLEAVVIAVILALLAVFIRRGKGWSRWAFAVLSFLFFGDLFRITAIFSSTGNGGYRAMTSLTALATWVAIGFLFTPWSTAFFRGNRPASTRPSPFGSMFKPRPPAARPAANRTKSAPRVIDAEPATATPKRTSPRGKSRKGGRR